MKYSVLNSYSYIDKSSYMSALDFVSEPARALLGGRNVYPLTLTKDNKASMLMRIAYVVFFPLTLISAVALALKGGAVVFSGEKRTVERINRETKTDLQAFKAAIKTKSVIGIRSDFRDIKGSKPLITHLLDKIKRNKFKVDQLVPWVKLLRENKLMDTHQEAALNKNLYKIISKNLLGAEILLNVADKLIEMQPLLELVPKERVYVLINIYLEALLTIDCANLRLYPLGSDVINLVQQCLLGASQEEVNACYYFLIKGALKVNVAIDNMLLTAIKMEINYSLFKNTDLKNDPNVKSTEEYKALKSWVQSSKNKGNSERNFKSSHGLQGITRFSPSFDSIYEDTQTMEKIQKSTESILKLLHMYNFVGTIAYEETSLEQKISQIESYFLQIKEFIDLESSSSRPIWAKFNALFKAQNDLINCCQKKNFSNEEFISFIAVHAEALKEAQDSYHDFWKKNIADSYIESFIELHDYLRDQETTMLCYILKSIQEIYKPDVQMALRSCSESEIHDENVSEHVENTHEIEEIECDDESSYLENKTVILES